MILTEVYQRHSKVIFWHSTNILEFESKLLDVINFLDSMSNLTFFKSRTTLLVFVALLLFQVCLPNSACQIILAFFYLLLHCKENIYTILIILIKKCGQSSETTEPNWSVNDTLQRHDEWKMDKTGNFHPPWCVKRRTAGTVNINVNLTSCTLRYFTPVRGGIKVTTGVPQFVCDLGTKF